MPADVFNTRLDGLDHHSLEWFFVIQEELMHEWIENGRGGGFVHNGRTLKKTDIVNRCVFKQMFSF